MQHIRYPMQHLPCPTHHAQYHMIALLFLLFPLADAVAGGLPDGAVPLRLPLHFVVNAGQWEDAAVRFGMVRGTDKAAFTRTGVRLYRPRQRPVYFPAGDMPALPLQEGNTLLETATVEFVRPSPNMRMEGIGRIDMHTNFYRGADSTRWRADVPTYRGVRYVDAWDGIDVEYVEEGGKLRRRILVHEGADTSLIAFRTSNITGGELVPVENAETGGAGGSGTPAETLNRPAPPYRNFFELRKVIETEFNTYFGGSGAESAQGFDGDDEGNIHLFLLTTSFDFPVVNAFQDTHAGGKTIWITLWHVSTRMQGVLYSLHTSVAVRTRV
jgi:hypothetical protein